MVGDAATTLLFRHFGRFGSSPYNAALCHAALIWADADMTDNPAATETYATPTAPLKNRLFCMVYEAMLLFGVVFIAGWLFSTLLQQRHALALRHGQQVWQFIVLGVYFGWFWTHGGHTLAMKTWRVRVVTRAGQALSWPRALLRYLLAWLWFLPGLVLAWWLEARGSMLLLLPMLNAVLWALTSRLDPDRQFLHDRIAGTRLVLGAAAKDPLEGKPISDQSNPQT
jgi:uncharacterized RDD family membrane protein YckC